MAQHWLAREGTIRRLWWSFVAVLALLVLADLVVDHDGHFGIDESFGFHAWYGFVSCVAMIAIAKLLGAMLKRPDAYYDE